MKKGFTLIELLVVVLIIGILAAVAMPQYQTALLKSRLGSAIPIADAIKLGAEMDFAENRHLTDSTADLPIAPPASCGKDSGGMVVCPNVYLDLSTTGATYDVLVLVPNRATAEVGYRVWLNVPPNETSNRAGQRECWAVNGNTRAAAVCKSLSGRSAKSGNVTYDKNWDVYVM